MSKETLTLLLVVYVSSLLACTLLALHALIPATAVLSLAAQGVVGAFAFAQTGSSSKSTLTPTSAIVQETKP
jgi:hypothetical protein